MPEPVISALRARQLLGRLKTEGGRIIGVKTLARLVAREGLPCHPHPFGTGTRVFLESEIRAWWSQRLQIMVRPVPGPGRPRTRPQR